MPDFLNSNDEPLGRSLRRRVGLPNVVESGGGKADHVEQVYFTSFVMQ